MKTTDDLVSIIVPIFNTSKYLRRCINSLIGQSYRNIEIILIDDGSTDHSADICKTMRSIDKRITYLYQNNKGVSAARNEGMKRARGEWLCFVDSDDWADIDMVSKLLAVSEKADIVIGGYYFSSTKGLMKQDFFDDVISTQHRKEELYLIGNALGCSFYGATGVANVGVPWAKLYRKSVVEELAVFFPNGLVRMQDTIFNLQLFQKKLRIEFINYPIYYYCYVKESAVHMYNPSFESLSKNVSDWIEKVVVSDDNAIGQLKVFKKLSLLMETIKLQYCHSECNLKLNEKIKHIQRLCCEKDMVECLGMCDLKLFSMRQLLLIWLMKKRMYWLIYFLYIFKAKML